MVYVPDFERFTYPSGLVSPFHTLSILLCKFLGLTLERSPSAFLFFESVFFDELRVAGLLVGLLMASDSELSTRLFLLRSFFSLIFC